MAYTMDHPSVVVPSPAPQIHFVIVAKLGVQLDVVVAVTIDVSLAYNAM